MHGLIDKDFAPPKCHRLTGAHALNKPSKLPNPACTCPAFQKDQTWSLFERNCLIEQHNELYVIMRNTCRSLRYVPVGRIGRPAWRGSCCARQSVIVEGRRRYFWMPLFKGVHDTVMGAIEIGGWITGRQPLPLRSRIRQHETESRTAQSNREFLPRVTVFTWPCLIIEEQGHYQETSKPQLLQNRGKSRPPKDRQQIQTPKPLSPNKYAPYSDSSRTPSSYVQQLTMALHEP